MKIDPHNHKERYFNWKEKNGEGIPEISKENSDLILRYINDMEKGINVSAGSMKGSRGYPRLNTLIGRLMFFSKKFKALYGLNCITDISEEQLITFFSDMRNGVIKKPNRGEYKSVDTYANIFKSFWHWYQKINKKEGRDILDITLDLDTKQEKPKWVYLTEEQVKRMYDCAKYEYKVLIMFLFDTGIRSPTELVNVKVSDFYNDFKELNIREEISKTFGRRIKLMICSDLIKEYVKNKNLEREDYVFDIKPHSVNLYFKRLALRLFGDELSEAGERYSNLTMYDFRHISCCYWLPRYKSESALKYRFGWKKSERIHYYSELLGMKDTINEEDLLVDVTKTEIEKRLTKSEHENEMLREEMEVLRVQNRKIIELVQEAFGQVKVKRRLNKDVFFYNNS